jgi:L-lactate dehydrogenase complex protein LldF
LPRRWAWRAVPALAERPARDALFGRSFAPAQPGPWINSGARGKTIAYFVHCVTDRFAPEQALAAVRLLQACGARVSVPASQHCCGLPQLDSGDITGACQMAKSTIEGLENIHADYVVTAVASCAAAILHDYAHLLRDEPEWMQRAQRLADRTLDLLSFVDRVASPPPLPSNSGADGSTSIEYPEVGHGIVRRKLDNVQATGARVLCSDNPGCILHMRGAAEAAGDPLSVRHVVELLAKRVSV